VKYGQKILDTYDIWPFQFLTSLFLLFTCHSHALQIQILRQLRTLNDCVDQRLPFCMSTKFESTWIRNKFPHVKLQRVPDLSIKAVCVPITNTEASVWHYMDSDFKNCRCRWEKRLCWYFPLCYSLNHTAVKWNRKQSVICPNGGFSYVPTSFFSWIIHALAKILLVSGIINLPKLFHVKRDYFKVHRFLLNSWAWGLCQETMIC
jgi:hypothetical protein